MRRFLDGLYIVSGALSAIMILAICTVVSLQVVFNIITRMRLFEMNLTIPSYADISGFLLAAASFLALPYALTRGGHIRVTLLLTVAGDRVRYVADLFSLLLCGAISAGATYYMASLTLESYTFDDRSPGILAIPIWVGQVPLTIGLGVLTIAFADLFVRTIREGSAIPDAQGVE